MPAPTSDVHCILASKSSLTRKQQKLLSKFAIGNISILSDDASDRGIKIFLKVHNIEV